VVKLLVNLTKLGMGVRGQQKLLWKKREGMGEGEGIRTTLYNPGYEAKKREGMGEGEGIRTTLYNPGYEAKPV